MPENLRTARLCYDHLAGQLDTEVSEKLLSCGWLTQFDETHGAYDVTPEGEQALAVIGADVSALYNGRRHFVYDCMDWSERRPRLTSALGAAVVERCIALGWLTWQKHSRALNMTEVGQRELYVWLCTAQGPAAVCQLVPQIDLTQLRWDTCMRSAL